MNDEVELEITCIHCLEKGTKKLFPIIKSDNLRAKELIFNDELFLYRCSHCGHYQKIVYECVYYDDKLKYAVILSHDGSKKISKMEVNKYQIRFVKELNELKEKIIIKEHNLDDRIVEIMKNKIRSTITSKATYRLFLVNDHNELVFMLVYPNNEIIKTYTFDYTMYFDLKNKYEKSLLDDYIVDAKYASKIILNSDDIIRDKQINADISKIF